LLPLGALAAFILFHAAESSGNSAVFHEAVVALKDSAFNSQSRTQEGFWVGDVTELYRWGVVSKQVAEADIAPIRPLVPKPRPFHGYHVVAMETAPGEADGQTIVLKGRERSKENFAFCIYPVGRGQQHRWVYIVTSIGIFGRATDSDQPILKWPTGEWRKEWAIID
jgi:hypothetical protein